MGYTITANTQGRFTTNAEFRTWGSWIGNAMANAGFANTGDTGQIDWATVTAPTTTSTMQGYEVWGFNDALQNTAPVFIKFEYGSGSAGNTVPQIRWYLGSGTSGNGSVTGFVCKDPTGGTSGNGFTILAQGAAFANATLVSYFCGDVNRFVMALNARGTGSSASYVMLLSMERTVDANGNVTGDGVMIDYREGTSPYVGEALWSPVLGTLGHNSGTVGCLGLLTPQAGTGVTGGNTAVYPVFHNKNGGAFLNPGLNLFGYLNSDFTAGSANTFTHYGASHTYMPLGNTATYQVSARSTSNACLMMRWE